MKKIISLVAFLYFAVSNLTAKDIYISGFNIPTSAYVGSTNSISVTLGNNGIGFTTSFWVSFNISPNSTYSAGGSTYLTDYFVSGGMTANSTKTISLNITIPTGYATGTKYIIIGADALNDVTGEISETNNELGVSILIKTYPDLTPAYFNLSSTTFNPGSNITASFKVQNTGTTSATNFNCGFYLSSTLQLNNPSGSYIDQYFISSVAANTTTGTFSTSLTIPASVTPGTYWLHIWVDNGQSVTESNESNNFQNYQVTVNCNSISSSFVVANQSVTAPSSATFNISATGSSISYQWQVSTNNGTTWNNITNSSPYSGATTSTLTVNPSAVSMDGYLYRCFLNNCNTSAYTSWATLTVTSSCTAISVSTNPSSQTVTAPSSATFSCSTSAGTSISYQWEYSSNGGSTWNNVPNSSPYSNTTSSSLFVSPTSSSINNYRYRCFLSNTCSSQTTGSAILTVNSIPPVANFTVNRNNIIAGQSVQFTDLSSNAPTLLNWNISGGSPFELHTASASSFSITFHSPGKYNITLIASNSAGSSSPLTRNAYITVQPQGTNQCIPPPNYCTQQGWYDASVSDPIHLGTGTYKYIHSDLIVSSSITKLVFTRIYNSINNNIAGPLGNGWSHSYNYIVYNFSDTLWQVKYPDGHLADFVPLYDGGGSSFALYGGMTDTLYKTATEFNLITKEKNKYKFSLGGQLRSIQDPNSNIISLHYKGNLLDSIVSSSGRFIHLTGDSTTGKISSVSSTLGKTCYFSIDSNNNLIAATNPNSDTIHFRYDTSHQLLSFINPLGDTVLTNIYTNGYVTGQYDAYNKLTSISYNSPSVGYTTVTYPDNSQEKYFHNQFTVNTQKIDALNKLSSTTYTENYLPDTITNEKGQNTLLSYDRYGNPLNIKLSGNRNYSTKYNDFQKPTEISNPLGYVTTFNYDSVHGNLKKINLPDTSSRIFEYFTNGTVRYYVDGIGDSTFYFYNSFGDLIKVNSPVGQRRFGYTADGKLDSITDENGNLTLLFYDNNENVIQIKDALNQSLFFSYDKDNQLISFKDKNGYTSYLYYDKKGRKVAQKNAMAGIDSFYYDLRDNLITWKDANGHFTYNGYDAKGRDTSITNAAGITKIAYDDIDNIVKITDPNKHIVSLGYNSSNFTNTIVDALLQSDSISYDGIGNTNSYKNYKSNTKSHNYNPLNQLSKTTDVEGKVTTFRHNKNGMLSSFTDGNSNTQNFNFGKSNRLQTYIDAAGNTYSYSYDSVGNIKTINKPVGNITNQYDKLNRLKTQSISTGDVYSFNYDANNNITSASNNTGTSNFFYDSLNRMYKYVDLYGKQVLYGYNSVGSITYIVYPGNDTVKYIYDDANRLWNVIDWKGRIFTYTYDSAGKVKKLLYPNGIRCEYEYDAINRLTSKITYQPNDTILYGQTFSFYNDSIIEYRYGTFPAGIESAQRRYQYSADDVALSDSVRTFRNDSNGNRTKDIFLSDTVSYTYTADQLLTSIIKGGELTRYKYDALGHRTERINGNDITHFVLNLNSPISLVLQTTDGNGVKKANYVYGLGLLESIDINDSVRYFHFDSGHNTIAITDDNDSVKATYTYLPYGELSEKTGTILQPFTFLGEFGVEQETDSCYYIRARYYDASTRRFLSKDPLFGDGFEPQSLNRYVYSLNNPLQIFDPTGLTGNKDNDGFYNRILAQTNDAIDNGRNVEAFFGIVSAMGYKAGETAIDIILFETLFGDFFVIGGVSEIEAVESNAAKNGIKYTKSNLKLGQEMHKEYKLGEEGIKEFRLPSGKRIDFLDLKNGKVFELKPYNPRSMKLGQTQLDTYIKELQTIPEFKGINWKGILQTY